MITLHLTSLVYTWNTQKNSHMSISSLHLINAILYTPLIRIDTGATQKEQSLRRHEAAQHISETVQPRGTHDTRRMDGYLRGSCSRGAGPRCCRCTPRAAT